jgi:hypothetical protein
MCKPLKETDSDRDAASNWAQSLRLGSPFPVLTRSLVLSTDRVICSRFFPVVVGYAKVEVEKTESSRVGSPSHFVRAQYSYSSSRNFGWAI